MEVTRRIGLPACILALVLAGTARSAENTIAILGSSTAAGVGASTYDSAFAGRYAKYLGGLKPSWKLVNLAVGGYTTYHIMPTGWKRPAGRPAPDTARNITKVLALKPSALLICMLSNDINNGYPASEYNANYDSVAAWAVKAGIPTWITTVVPRTAFDAAKRKELLALRDRILTRFAPHAINFYDSLGDAEGNYLPGWGAGDGIHTNDKGHALLFRRVVAANLTSAAMALAPRFRPEAGLPVLLAGPAGAGPVLALPAGRFDLRGRFAGPPLPAR